MQFTIAEIANPCPKNISCLLFLQRVNYELTWKLEASPNTPREASQGQSSITERYQVGQVSHWVNNDIYFIKQQKIIQQRIHGCIHEVSGLLLFVRHVGKGPRCPLISRHIYKRRNPQHSQETAQQLAGHARHKLKDIFLLEITKLHIMHDKYFDEIVSYLLSKNQVLDKLKLTTVHSLFAMSIMRN